MKVSLIAGLSARIAISTICARPNSLVPVCQRVLADLHRAIDQEVRGLRSSPFRPTAASGSPRSTKWPGRNGADHARVLALKAATW